MALLTVLVWSREVCVSAVPLPLLGWSLSARGMHSLEKSHLEPWWAQQDPAMAGSDSHTRRQGRGGVPHGILFAVPDLSAASILSSPLGSH